MIKNADRVYHGGDYNPDQWDEATIDEDWANQHWMTKNYSKIDDVANGITS